MLKEKQVELNEPLLIGGKDVSVVTVRRPNVGDEEDAMEMCISFGRQDNRVTLEICLFSRVSGIPYDKLRQMCPEDYTLIREAMQELADQRPTKKVKEETEQKA